MPSRRIDEVLLATAVGSRRASAITGDLLELAEGRGQRWYWRAWFSVYFSVVWRTITAFLIGLCGVSLFYWFRELIPQPNLSWMLRHGLSFDRHAYLVLLLRMSALELWFLVPFATFRNGLRDRSVPPAAGLLLLLTCGSPYLFLPGVALTLTATLSILLLVMALTKQWHRTSLTLASSFAVGTITLLCSSCLAHLYCWIYEHKPLNTSSHFRFFDIDYAFPMFLFHVVTCTIICITSLMIAITYSKTGTSRSKEDKHSTA